jgi:hypothetical protein
LVSAYKKFIPNLGILASFLNDPTKPKFNKYMTLKENNKAISHAIDNIKAIISSNLCLILSLKDENTFIV